MTDGPSLGSGRSGPGGSLNLLHLANYHSTNIGNGALIFGTERVIREDLGEDIRFTPEPWDDYTLLRTRRFDAAFVDRVNRDYDALLVGAAVTLNARKHFSNAGMRFDLPIELWSRFRKPVCFYAISHRVWPAQHYYHLGQFQKTMDAILQNPRVLFSVRNDDTLTFLEETLGYRSDRITVIPDPAMYVPTRDCWHPQLVDGKVNLIISLNNEDPVYRFGGRGRRAGWKVLGRFVDENRLLAVWNHLPGWRARRRRVLTSLAAALDTLAREWDLNVILAPHTFDDYEITHEFLSYCSPRVGYQLAVSTGVLKVAQAASFYDLYAKADVALSMRVHSLVPALGLGTPCVALTSQSRITAFMRNVHLDEYVVDAFDQDLADRVCERVRYCLGNRDKVREHLRETRARLRAQSAEYHQRIRRLLEA